MGQPEVSTEGAGPPATAQLEHVINNAANNQLKLLTLGFLTLPAAPFTDAELWRGINDAQGDYPGYLLNKDQRTHLLPSSYCRTMLRAGGLIYQTTKPSKSNCTPRAKAHAALPDMVPSIEAIVGAFGGWELDYPDYSLQEALGAQSDNRNNSTTQVATNRLRMYRAITESDKPPTFRWLSSALGKTYDEVENLLYSMEEVGIVVRDQERDFFSRRKFMLTGLPIEHIPKIPAPAQSAYKALYALVTELFVRGVRETTGAELLSILTARYPNIPSEAYKQILQLRPNVPWSKFLDTPKRSEYPDLYRREVILDKSWVEPLGELALRYTALLELPGAVPAWRNRGRDILSDQAAVAELMEKFKETSRARNSRAVDEKDLVLRLARLLQPGAQTISQLCNQLADQGLVLRREFVRRIICESPYFTYQSSQGPGKYRVVALGSAAEPVATPKYQPKGPWQHYSNCTVDDMLDSAAFLGDQIEERIQATCTDCSVRGQCLAFGMQYFAAANRNDSVWGGMTPAQLERYTRMLPASLRHWLILQQRL